MALPAALWLLLLAGVSGVESRAWPWPDDNNKGTGFSALETAQHALHFSATSAEATAQASSVDTAPAPPAPPAQPMSVDLPPVDNLALGYMPPLSLFSSGKRSEQQQQSAGAQLGADAAQIQDLVLDNRPSPRDTPNEADASALNKYDQVLLGLSAPPSDSFRGFMHSAESPSDEHVHELSMPPQTTDQQSSSSQPDMTLLRMQQSALTSDFLPPPQDSPAPPQELSFPGQDSEAAPPHLNRLFAPSKSDFLLTGMGRPNDQQFAPPLPQNELTLPAESVSVQKDFSLPAADAATPPTELNLPASDAAPPVQELTLPTAFASSAANPDTPLPWKSPHALSLESASAFSSASPMHAEPSLPASNPDAPLSWKPPQAFSERMPLSSMQSSPPVAEEFHLPDVQPTQSTDALLSWKPPSYPQASPPISFSAPALSAAEPNQELHLPSGDSAASPDAPLTWTPPTAQASPDAVFSEKAASFPSDGYSNAATPPSNGQDPVLARLARIKMSMAAMHRRQSQAPPPSPSFQEPPAPTPSWQQPVQQMTPFSPPAPTPSWQQPVEQMAPFSPPSPPTSFSAAPFASSEAGNPDAPLTWKPVAPEMSQASPATSAQFANPDAPLAWKAPTPMGISSALSPRMVAFHSEASNDQPPPPPRADPVVDRLARIRQSLAAMHSRRSRSSQSEESPPQMDQQPPPAWQQPPAPSPVFQPPPSSFASPAIPNADFTPPAPSAPTGQLANPEAPLAWKPPAPQASSQFANPDAPIEWKPPAPEGSGQFANPDAPIPWKAPTPSLLDSSSRVHAHVIQENVHERDEEQEEPPPPRKPDPVLERLLRVQQRFRAMRHH